MTLRIFQVDAFTDQLFQGNPAAVCLLEGDLPDATLQAIARENSLPETAFFDPGPERPRLRWFTPTQEVRLCGHATLASGYVALTHLRPGAEAITFESVSGLLTVSRAGDGFRMDFPRVAVEEVEEPPAELIRGLGVEPEGVLRSATVGHPNYLAILGSEAEVDAVEPDHGLLATLHPAGTAVTAPGREVDFVSRYFAPSYGIPEDPVTGSLHCALGPYWAGRLGRDRMTAVQRSHRPGTLEIQVLDDRVLLAGAARLYLEGRVSLPEEE